MYDKLLFYYMMILFSGGMLLSVFIQIPAHLKSINQQKSVLTNAPKPTSETPTAETFDEQYTKFLSKISRRNEEEFKMETLQAMNEHIREMLKKRNKLDEYIQVEQEYKAFLAQRLAYAIELAKFVDELEKRFSSLCEENKSTEADYMRKFPNEIRLLAVNRTCSLN